MKNGIVKMAVLAMLVLSMAMFFSCEMGSQLEIDELDIARNTAGTNWNFTASATGLTDYSTNGNKEITSNITYANNMTLRGGDRSFRWLPKQASPGSGASVGCIQTGGATSSGKYFLTIANVKGPMKVTLVYTDTGSGNSGRTIEYFVNGASQKKTSGTNGLTVMTSTFDYTGTSTVTIQLGCSGGIRLYDVKLSAISSSSSGSSSSGSSSSGTASSGSGTTNNSQANTIFNNLKGKKVTTNGWADRYNNGSGLSYANPSSLTLIEGTSNKAKREAFTNAIKSDSAKFIILSGDVDLSDGKITDSNKSYFNQFNSNGNRTNGDIVFQMGSNTTLIGINNARIMFGGIQIKGKSNIIIRNLTFYDAHGSTEKNTSVDSNSKASADALEISGTSNGIWVNHCRFTDGTCNDMIRNLNHDGAFDIKRGQNITVSWNEFTNHDKVMLVGSNDTDYLTATERQITLHNNYFHKVTQRLPRTRGTQMHIYNNYYNNIGVSGNTGYIFGPGVNAQFIIENNNIGSRFHATNTKIVDFYDSSARPARVFAAGNNVTVEQKGSGRPWTPAYSFSLKAASGLTSLANSTGPRLNASSFPVN